MSLPAPDMHPGSPPRCSRDSLRLLDRCAHPMWIYGFDAQEIVWANPAGLAFWRARDVAALRQRDVSPKGPGTRQRLENLKHLLTATDMRQEQWTFYPQDEPVSLPVSLSLAQMDDAGLGLLVEGRAHDHGETDWETLAGVEQRTVEAVRQTSLMISMLSEHGFWLMHNPAAEGLMRRVGLHNVPNFDNFLAMFDDRALAKALREQAVTNGSARATLRVASRLPHIHDVTIRTITDPVTGHPSFIVSQQDVTRTFMLELRLQQALEKERQINETQRHFLSLTSHEFRTPLSIIAGSVRRVRRIAADDERVMERMDIIAQAVERMVGAIDKTLSGARIAEGKVPCTLVPTDLAPIITQAVAVQRQLHRDRRFSIDIQPLPPVMADAGIVEQILDNMLSNAIKYSPADKPVEIIAAVADGRVALSVTDHGIGIPAQEQQRIFDRFYRASNARGIKGTGIGLHAVRYFMALHHGTVHLESREGQGACITASFPL